MVHEPVVRYGILGFGQFAQRAIGPAIGASTNSRFVAIQKRSLDSAKTLAKEHNVPHAFDRVDDLVKHPDVDAVFIVSANSEHCPQTVAAAQAGKHVLVEKPMANSTREAQEMIDACRKHNVKLMVAHMIRFSPLALRLRELVHTGALGRIVAARSEFYYDARLTHRDWLFSRTVAGGGPVFDIGVHCLDTLRFVLGQDVTSVRSELCPLPNDRDTEATAQVALKFAGGTVGSIFCSYDAPRRRSMIEIMGTEGMASADDFTLGSRMLELNVELRNQSGGIEGRTERLDIPNLYVEEITYFSRCILEDRQPEVDGTVGLENQRLIDAMLLGS